MNEALPILAEVRRGPIVESRHRGAIIAVEPDGRVIARTGDDQLVTSTRSTIKPIQALPIITSGAADHFQFQPGELALCCASHNGEPLHTESVASILSRIGLTEDALLCGSHVPYSDETSRELERRGQRPNQLHNNCSGKHAGMLATAVHLGLSIENYVSPEHPVQQRITSVLASLTDLDGGFPTAIDGCGAPTFGVPLRSLALAFARLVSGSWDSDPEIASASCRIVEAMIANPQMVGGTKGRLDTELLIAGEGKLICKVGAEAVYSVGVLPCDLYPRGLGIAAKVEDGSYRGMAPAVIESLSQLRVLDGRQTERLAHYHRPLVENRRGRNVGEVCAVFQLELYD